MMNKVVVGFIFKENKLLLIKHKKKNMWLPVGGHVEPGETLLEALKREIKEEVSLIIKCREKPFFVLREKGETTNHYTCKYLSGKIKIMKEEIKDFKWLTKKEVNNSKLCREIKRLAIKAFEENMEFDDEGMVK